MRGMKVKYRTGSGETGIFSRQPFDPFDPSTGSGQADSRQVANQGMSQVIDRSPFTIYGFNDLLDAVRSAPCAMR
jgi:hypothetical protein